MTELERIRQRIETLVDRWMQHPDRIPAAEACTQVLAALDGPLPVEESPSGYVRVGQYHVPIEPLRFPDRDEP